MIDPKLAVEKAKELTPTERRNRIGEIEQQISKLNNTIRVVVSDATDEEGFRRRIENMQKTVDLWQKRIDDAICQRENAKDIIDSAYTQIKELSTERTLLQNADEIAKFIAIQEKLNDLGATNLIVNSTQD